MTETTDILTFMLVTAFVLFLLPISLILSVLSTQFSAPPPRVSETSFNTAINGGGIGRRRSLRPLPPDSDDDESGGGDEGGDYDSDGDLFDHAGRWRVVMRPVPEGVRGCLKRPGSPALSSFHHFGNDSDTGSASGRKTVRLVEPDTKASLVALREFWTMRWRRMSQRKDRKAWKFLGSHWQTATRYGDARLFPSSLDSLPPPLSLSLINIPSSTAVPPPSLVAPSPVVLGPAPGAPPCEVGLH
ncbi:hypothetical protein T439DRAFT_65113 [Meredithblackwellia eburnea MCA 4105]